jgi:hypothetical protein
MDAVDRLRAYCEAMSRPDRELVDPPDVEDISAALALLWTAEAKLARVLAPGAAWGVAVRLEARLEATEARLMDAKHEHALTINSHIVEGN